MASPVTKTTYVDIFDSAMPGHVEIGYRNKKAWIKRGTLEIINPAGIPLNLQAMALALSIADHDNCYEKTLFGNTRRTLHEPMNMRKAREYLRNLQERSVT